MTRLLMSIILLLCCSASVVMATNITASTSADRSEDRIQVLRGMAEVLIKESMERITLREGEELIVRTGGRTEKTEIDIGGESKKWQQELGKLGDSIQLREIQETLLLMRENETETFKKLQDTFKALSNKEGVTEAEEQEFRKTSERLAGVLSEDALIMNAIHQKLEKTLSDPNTSPSDKSLVAGYMKTLAAAKAGSQGFQLEISKISRVNFIGSRAPTLSVKAEVEALSAALMSSKESLDAVLREVQSNPGGLSQDWFAESQGVVNAGLKTLSDLAVKANSLLEKDPTNPALLALVKIMSNQMNQLSQTLKSLAVVTVTSDTLVQIRQSDDQLSERIVQLLGLIDKMKANGMSLDEIARDPQVLMGYSVVRSLYLESQRLYDSTMRAAAGSMFRTAEQEELANTWERVSNSFQQLGAIGEGLQTRLQEVMNIISKYAKDGDPSHLSREQLDELNKELIGAGYNVTGLKWIAEGYVDGVIDRLIFVRAEVDNLNDASLPGTPPLTSQPTVTQLGNYSHLSWGEWSSQTTVPDLVDFTETHWISGSLTPGLNIPIQGVASFNGQVLGTLSEAGVISRISGTTNLLADFTSRNLSGTFNMVRSNGSNWASASMDAAWTAGNNNISGTLNSNNGMSGTVNGHFYGPAAQQVGGKWNLQGNNNQAAGIFVATQPQSN